MTSGINKIKKFIQQGYKIYIYGTGLWGRNIYSELKKNNIGIDGFVVTKKESMEKLFEISILEYQELEHINVILILGLNQHNTKEVEQFLIKNKFPLDRVIYSNEMMNLNDVRCGYDEIPCLDITTKIGCSINCKYCPQDVLLKNYFRNNPNRDVFLSKETLIKCMEHMPDNTNYQFCGMAEPFLNPECLELIRIVCEANHTVNLYTTLVGLNEEKLYRLMDLPIDYITLHVADAKGYAKISLTEDYYRMLDIVINSKKKNGNMFIDMCNAQAEPEKRVSEICKDKYIISNTLLDRAGNLTGEKLVSKCLNSGKIKCGVCGYALNKNELLPDGTLLLCCMDYGMVHELGNLKEQTYEEIMAGKEIQRIRKGMLSASERRILCRSCSCANLEV